MEHPTETARTDDESTDPDLPETSRNYPAGYDHVSDITRPLNDLINAGYSGYRVFEDWIDMTLASLMGDDDAYDEAIADYESEELKLFAKAFGQVLATTREYEVDVLGDVYEALGMNSKHFAQHFTPHSVSEGMADIQTLTRGEADNDDSPPTIADPTCGSGRLLIAAARRMPEGVFFGQDKDKVCAKMTAINFCLFNIDGYVAYGDSLTMDVHRAWQTTGTDTGGAVREIEADALEDKVKSMVA